MIGQWHIELLGHLSLRTGSVVHKRFYSRKVALLLAWLAYHPNRQFGRDEIIEMLWPDCELRAGRANLRNVLAMLRRHLEPTGTPYGTVLLADYNHVSLNPDAFTSDVAQFEATLDLSGNQPNPTEKETLLRAALQRYSGDLLPGFFEDWVLLERERLGQRFRSALANLRDLAGQRFDHQAALDAAWQLVALQPGHEEAHLALIHLLVETGQRKTAQQQYEVLWRTLEEVAGEAPSFQMQQRATEWKLLPPKSDYFLPPPPQAVLESITEAPPPGTESPLVAVSPRVENERLPLLLTPTYGRDPEIRLLCDALGRSEVRLITVTGLGGIGKTRLAIETVHTYARTFTGRIVFVALAGITQADALPECLLRALAVSPVPHLPIQDQLVSALEGAPTLLLLDNFEHLVSGGAELIFALLSQVSTLKCLVTSRQCLNLDGEQVFSLQPLPLPEETASLEQLLECPSVQLLVDRGRAIRPEFQVTAHNAEAMKAVCRMLEGLPLAIELAAGRISVVPVNQMSKQLEQSLAFLVGRKRNVASRHRSIRAMLDWSFQLLSAPEQGFLARLSVFRGGWTREAAEYLCTKGNALDLLESLCTYSLLRAEENDSGVRYRMLEMVREYAAEKLEEGEATARTQLQHAAYFTQMAENAATQLNLGQESVFWLDRLEEEHNNLRQALAWRLRQVETVDIRLPEALLEFWITRGYLQEARHWFEAFLTRQTADSVGYVRTCIGLGRLAVEQGDLEVAHRRSTVALEIARRQRFPGETAEALLCLAQTIGNQGDDTRARELMYEALMVFREIGEDTKIAFTLNLIANTYFIQAEYSVCVPLYEESIARYQSLGNLNRAVTIRGNLGLVRMEMGDLFGGLHDIQNVLRVYRQARFKRAIAVALINLGEIFLRLGRWSESEEALLESQQLFEALKNRHGVCMVLDGLRRLWHRRGDLATAGQFACQALVLCRELGFNKRQILLNSLETLTYLAAEHRNWEYVATLYGASLSLGSLECLTFAVNDPAQRFRLEHDAQIALGPPAWETYRSQGTAFSWEQAVEYALRWNML